MGKMKVVIYPDAGFDIDGFRREMLGLAPEAEITIGTEDEAAEPKAADPAQTSAEQELATRYAYHAPHGNQATRHGRIRNACLELAKVINHLTPKSREQSSAFTMLDQVMFFANAAISRNEKPGTMQRE